MFGQIAKVLTSLAADGLPWHWLSVLKMKFHATVFYIACGFTWGGGGVGRTANDHAPLALFSMERANPRAAVCSPSIPKVYFSNTPPVQILQFRHSTGLFSNSLSRRTVLEPASFPSSIFLLLLKTDCQKLFPRNLGNENSLATLQLSNLRQIILKRNS